MRVAILAVILLVAACGDVAETPGTVRETTSTTATTSPPPELKPDDDGIYRIRLDEAGEAERAAASAVVAAAAARWEERALDAYTMTYRVPGDPFACHDEITAVVRTGEPEVDHPDCTELGPLGDNVVELTMERLLASAAQAVESADLAVVWLDVERGEVVRLSVDWVFEALDEQTGYEVRSLVEG